MATTQLEINSFVGKFAQLCANGINASLNLSRANGKVVVNFHAELGRVALAFNCRNCPKNSSLSKKRRRKRRRESPSPFHSLQHSTLVKSGDDDIENKNNNIGSAETGSLSLLAAFLSFLL